jgi:DNA adenine methylase
MRILSPFRYPGGKSWLRKKVIKWISGLDYRPALFIEPFAGGASVGLAVAEMALADQVLLVERDPDVASVWQVILGDQWEALAERIHEFQMSRRRVLGVLGAHNGGAVAKAFRCVLRNRVQRGGILASSAGLLRKGEAGRGLKSRWYAETLISRIEAINKLRDRIRFCEGDGLSTITAHQGERDCAYFVDPPYTANGKGPGYRLYSYAGIDHERLLESLSQVAGACFITYHPAAHVKRIGKQLGFKVSTTGMKTTHHAHRRELILLKPPAETASSLIPPCRHPARAIG